MLFTPSVPHAHLFSFAHSHTGFFAALFSLLMAERKWLKGSERDQEMGRKHVELEIQQKRTKLRGQGRETEGRARSVYPFVHLHIY